MITSAMGRRSSRRSAEKMRGHQWEMERHVTLVAVAEVLRDLLGYAVGLGEQDADWVLRVDDPSQLPQEGVRLGKVRTLRALPRI